MASDPTPSPLPWLDPTLWISVLTPVMGVLNKKLGLNLSAADVVPLVLPLVVYIISHQWTSHKVAIAKINAK